MSEPTVAVPERAGPSGVGAESARRWWILGVVGLAQLMVILDATIVNIALPSAQSALGFSNADRQWVVTAYSLAFGGLLLLGGRLSDLVGRRRMLIIGLVGFAAASALGGAATSFAMLVIGRGLQGAFGAMLAPAALSTLTVTFSDPAERGKAFGVYGAIAGAGGAVGLLLGGVLTEYLSWRWCLYVNVILGAVAVAGAVRLLAAQPRDRGVQHRLAGNGLGGGRAGAAGLRAVRGRHRGLGRADDPCAAGVRGGPAGRVRAGRAAGPASAAAAANRREPVPRRRVPGHRAVRHRRVRDLPVPDLLLPADPGLLAGQVRAGLPADGRGDRRGVHHLQRGADAAGRAPAPDPGRHATRGRRPEPSWPRGWDCAPATWTGSCLPCC